LQYIQIIQLVLFACLMSLGQILFKKTALSISYLNNQEAEGLIDGILRAITIPWLYFALIVYGLATVFWLYLLQRIPLSLAYPFSALAMIIVPIVAYFLFKESLTFSYWIGMILILLGICIIAT